MRYLQAYITYWGQIAVINSAECLSRIIDCLSDCPIPKCIYRTA